MTTPFISIVVPLYNKEKEIGETLASILRQTMADFELIIVDDCSTDNSLSIASAISDNRISIITQKENSGVSVARNIGISHAASRFIAFIDADDEWLPNHLHDIAFLIQSFPHSPVFATSYYIQKNKTTMHECEYSRYQAHGRSHGEIDIGESKRIFFNSSSITITKELFETIGTFNPHQRNGEDIDLWIRMLAHTTVAYHFAPSVVYHYSTANMLKRTASDAGHEYSLFPFGSTIAALENNPTIPVTRKRVLKRIVKNISLRKIAACGTFRNRLKIRAALHEIKAILGSGFFWYILYCNAFLPINLYYYLMLTFFTIAQCGRFPNCAARRLFSFVIPSPSPSQRSARRST
ncbi:MAG: glycosyltransferase family 2 protein [Chitinivibrionales bacterium]|nr:glycosyltransferase family 2 protein [Chitinivibrionales bacterium]